MAEQWEYKSVLCSGGDNMEAVLTPLGAQGWEAVGFAPVVINPTNYTQISQYNETIATVTQWSAVQYRVLLKRRKP
ncbi:MAG TPA: hypothetical protein VH591_07295 [Ktedonobacterales bacterium]|jgi:hypothetical protein